MKNKKIIFILLLIFTLTGCKTKTYTVSFDTLGGSKIESKAVCKKRRYSAGL